MSSLLLAVAASALASSALGSFCQCEAKAEFPFAAGYCATITQSSACDANYYCQPACGCECGTTAAYANDPGAAAYCQSATQSAAACQAMNPIVCEPQCVVESTQAPEYCSCEATQSNPGAAQYCSSFASEPACPPGPCEYTCGAQCGCLALDAAYAGFCAQFPDTGSCETSGASMCRYSPCAVEELALAARARAAADLAWFEHKGLVMVGGAAVLAGAAALLAVRRRKAAAEPKYTALPEESSALLAA